jgi:hypothetical protein
MIWTKVTADDFQSANTQTRCIQIVSAIVQDGGTGRLCEIAEFFQGNLEVGDDTKLLDSAYIARYKPNQHEQTGWQYTGSSNYTIKEFADLVQSKRRDFQEGKEILDLADSLRSGLEKDVVIATAVDSSLEVRLIVDGLHRATALAVLSATEPAKLKTIFESNHKVSIIELRSRWAHLLYPCDFLDFCAQREQILRAGGGTRVEGQ